MLDPCYRNPRLKLLIILSLSPGLIVGVMIRYLGKATERTHAIAYLENSTAFGPDDPPVVLRLNLSDKMYQYGYEKHISDHDKVKEKELEEKVSMCHNTEIRCKVFIVIQQEEQIFVKWITV